MDIVDPHLELQVGHGIEPKANKQPFPKWVVGHGCE